MRAILAVVTAGLIGACASGSVAAPEREDVDSRLRSGVDLHAYAGGTLAITGRRHAGDGESTSRAVLEVADASGRAQLDPDDVLWLEGLDVTLADVVVWPGALPITLTDLKVTLVTPASAPPLYGSGASGTVGIDVPVELLLTWAVRTDSGAVTPLAPQRLGPFDLRATFVLDDLDLVVGRVVLSAPGEIWSWGSVLFLEKPELTVDVTDHPRAHGVD